MDHGVNALLLDHMRAVREDVKSVNGQVGDLTGAVARMDEKLSNIERDMQDLKGHGERLALLEQWRRDQETNSDAARAERRANLALGVSVLIALASWLQPLLMHGHK